MTRYILPGAFVLATIAAPAMSDTCGSNGHTSDLPATGVTSLLNPGGNVYVCYNPGSGRENNETLLSGGTFQEYHLGGNTVQNEGAWTIASTTDGDNGSAGTIQYAYTQGGTYTYYICSANSGSTYYIINTSTSTVLTVQITPSAGTC